ncbi:MAG TPA: glyoxalase-like domain protein [Micromonosporaceae bacterium]|nr:glyoxalase-like domain protein [Micromonosporaceae bacterium]
MRVNYQVAIDCADPHLLAAFWSQALGWTVEDHSDRIKQLIEQGHVTEDDIITIDGRLAFKEAAAVRDPEAKVASDGLPERGRMLFQVVPEPKTAKNRMHLDLHLGAEDREAEVARLIGLGATKLWDAEQGGHKWDTLADPEGNEFCVA